MKSYISEHRFGGGAGAGLAVLLGLTFLMSPLGKGLERLSYDLPFLLKPEIKTDAVVIVYIDDMSARNVGQAYGQRLDRARLAQLVERLTADRAKAVVFDIELDQAGTDAQADRLLAEAIRASGRVVLGSNVDESGAYGDPRIVKEILPLALFRTNAAALGLVGVDRETDQMVRHISAGRRHLPTVTKSLSWATAELLGAAVTTNTAGRWHPRWVNYYGPPAITLPGVSYYRALDTNDLRPDFFRDKIVFVGAKSGTGFLGDKKDEFRHPLTGWGGGFISGVEIHATMLVNLLRGDWLNRLSLWTELVVALILGLGFGFGLAPLRPLTAAGVALGGVLAIFIGACVLVSQAHVWTAWGVPAMVQVPAALAWAVLYQAHLATREKPILSSGHRPVVVAPLIEAGASTVMSTHAARTDGRLPAAEKLPALDIPDHELLRPVGRGSYGEVWLAKNVMGFARAVKVVRWQTFGEDRPFEREFEGIRQFEPLSRSHPNLVHILHVGRKEDYFYYVMELADDGSEIQNPKSKIQNWDAYSPRTLRSEIDRLGRLPLAECLSLSAALSSALTFLHQHGLLHRDLKPANIIFVNDVPKLADIGLVTAANEAPSFVGTVEYLPPEGPGTCQADVFSLGLVLYEIATGNRRKDFPNWPLKGATPTETELLRQLHDVIRHACDNDPHKRYENAATMKEELAKLAMFQLKLEREPPAA